MRWNKMGRVFVPDGQRRWQQHYAFPPTPWRRDADTLRIFVGMCDEETVGRVGWVDVSAKDPTQVRAVSEQPVLDIGQPGAFDDNGVVPTCVVEVDERLYLYYVGFQLGHRLRYFQFLGLAISDDGGASFQRAQRVPVIDRSDTELVNRTSGFVRRDDRMFRLWYVGGSDWTTVGEKTLPVYDIRCVESQDGINWPKVGDVAVPLRDDGDEHALGRPWVIRNGDGWRMFYSTRTQSRDYRIGFADSEDGRHWTRRDEEIGLDVSDDGWDSEMIAYGAIVDLDDRRFIFYCGNGTGRTGFGVAELIRPGPAHGWRRPAAGE
jgi:sucrose-6-phosphate hydrolase SacC (GH32 family)